MQQDLEIEDLVKGTGKTAERGALITAHYIGWLEDGTEFDSSYKKNIPFQTVLSNKRVIQGWIPNRMPNHRICTCMHILAFVCRTPERIEVYARNITRLYNEK